MCALHLVCNLSEAVQLSKEEIKTQYSPETFICEQ